MNTGEKVLSSYKGKEPYIFISYSHENMKEVLEIVAQLQNKYYRVWYDEGIDPGTEWAENIAKHVEKCSFFIAFISEQYIASDNCREELDYARELKKQRVLVYLKNVELTGGMRMRLHMLQAIHKYNYRDDNAFYEKLYTATGIEPCLDENPVTIKLQKEIKLYRLVNSKTGVETTLHQGTYIIGRERRKCDILIDNNSSISKIHACLIVKINEVYLRDLNTANGTYVNGVRLGGQAEILLHINDIIHISNEEFVILPVDTKHLEREKSSLVEHDRISGRIVTEVPKKEFYSNNYKESTTYKMQPNLECSNQLLFLIDTSASMTGERIDAVNKALVRTKQELTLHYEEKVALDILRYDSDVQWISEGELPLKTKGTTNLGAALKCLMEFGDSQPKNSRIVMIVISDGHSTDDYLTRLKKISQKAWYHRMCKIAIAIGDDADSEALNKITDNKNAMMRITELARFEEWCSSLAVYALAAQSKHLDSVDGHKVLTSFTDQWVEKEKLR